jgi:hypothetical protein
MANGDNQPTVKRAELVQDVSPAQQAANLAAIENPSKTAADSAATAEAKAIGEGKTPDSWKPLEFSIPKVSQEELAKSIKVDQAQLNAQRGNYKGRNAAGNPVFTDQTGHDYVLYAGTTPFADGRYYPEKGAIEDHPYESGSYIPDVDRQLAGTPNPYTGKPYDPVSMTDTEKLDALAQLKWHANLPPAPDGVKQDLNRLQTTINGVDGVSNILAKHSQWDFDNWAQLGVGSRSASGMVSPKDEDFFKVQEGAKSVQAAQQFLQAKADAGDSNAKALLAGLGTAVGAVFGKGNLAGDVGGAVVGDLLGSIAPQNYNKLRVVAPMYANALKSYYVNQADSFLKQYQPGNARLLDAGNRYVTDLNASGIPAHGDPISSSQMIQGPTKDAKGNPIAPVPEPSGTVWDWADAGIGNVLPETKSWPGAGTWIPQIGDWFNRTLGGKHVAPQQPPQATQGTTVNDMLFPPSGTAGYQHGGLVKQPMPAPLGGPKSSAPPLPPLMPAPIAQKPARRGPVPSYGTQAELDAAGHPPGTTFHWRPTNRVYVKI